MIKRLIIILAILLVACSSSSTTTENSNWKTGYGGISLAFTQNSPPTDLYKDESYSLVLEARNNGWYPGEDEDLDVDLYFSGFDQDLISLDDSDSISIQGGITQTNPQGGLEYYETEFDVGLWEDVDSLPQNIRVTACYPYETFAPIQVCVDPDPVRNEDDACTPYGGSGAGGQAAPIGITSIQQESLKGKVRFTIYVSNQGGGTVFTESNDCLRIDRSDSDTVNIIDAYLGQESMDCTPEDRVRLVNGQGIITCTAEVDEDVPAYTTSLGVNLEYNYKTSITKSVTIKKIE